jgi:glycine/D-amino acid oxidase-like deaminating enzyme
MGWTISWSARANNAMTRHDVIVIGGGMIGAAIAFGLVRLGRSTVLLDEGDVAFRAARGNFGLIWVQGKGNGCPEYAEWTRRSADIWSEFDAELSELSGVDTGYSRPGGMHLCLTRKDFADRSRKMSRMKASSDGTFQYEMLDHDALAERLPGLGPTVTGGSFSPMDGHVSPLYLLRALHASFKAKGGHLHIGAVKTLVWKNAAFEATTPTRVFSAQKIVLAAGLGSKDLAPGVGLNVPVHPERGQILVTGKLKNFLDYPTLYVRQTAEGSVLLGDSHEDVGFDDTTSAIVLRDIALRARRLFPHLARARIVRAWGALRILTPDGLPIYDQSREYPGAFSASAHSGVTLAAAHALDFARFVVQGELPPSLGVLSEGRFHVH